MEPSRRTAPVSVVLCTRDRADDLARCLASLAQQTVRPLEVVVVDAGTTPLAGLVEAWAAAGGDGVPLRQLVTEPGLPRQRNLGARAAAGDVVLYLDDDTVLEPEYLDALWAVYAADHERRVGGVGGVLSPDPTPREGAARRLMRRAFLLQSHGRGRVKRSGHPEFAFAVNAPRDVELLSGCNMSFRREVLATHAFDERLAGYALGEDLHFSYAVSRSWCLVVTPDARVDHRESTGGRPEGALRAEMGVRNRHRFVREQLVRRRRDWLPFAWSALGELLWTLRHPGNGQLHGRLRGYAAILAQAAGARDAVAARGARAGRAAAATPADGSSSGDGSVDAPGVPAPVLAVRDAACAGERPFVSVVVPARDEERSLPACLDSLLAQTYDAARTEILVVDNRSTDRTPDVVHEYAARDRRVRLLRCDGANQAAGMNAGMLAARGGIVARIDAHGWVEPEYLERAIAVLERHPDASAVGGPYLPACERLLERVSALARASRVGVGGGWYADRDATEHAVRTVGCPVYRRQAVLDAGMFDPGMAYGEDDELHWRLVKQGGAILFSPELRQYNRPRATLGGLGRQYWNYGRGRLRVLRKHPDFLLVKHLVPGAFVAVLAALAVLAVALPIARPALLALVGAYATALAVAAAAGAEHGWREALLVPCAVGIIHVAYGGGMLCGALASFAPVRRNAEGTR